MGPREGGGPGHFEPRGDGPRRFREDFDNVSAAFGGGTHDWLLWVLFALVLVLLLLSIASLLASSLRPRLMPALAGPRIAGEAGAAAEPLAIVRDRYARGDISREEFLTATSDLTAATPSAEAPTETIETDKS